jgi:drug/metabolite transporter (DMT)-like permease
MQPLRGIALKIMSVAVFMAMATIVKSVADEVPPGQTVFFRSLFAAPVIVVWLIWLRELPGGLQARDPMGHLWRGLVGVTAMGLGFAGLGLLPLPEVTAIGYAAPLLTVIFAAMFLGEEVRAFRLTAVAMGLVGVMIVLSPRLTLTEGLGSVQALGATLTLMSAVFAALAQVQVRKLIATEGTAAIVFWFSITAACFSLVTLPWGWVVPRPGTLALLILCGVLGGIGQILLTASYRHAPASVIAPFEYVSMILALAVGYAVFDEVPTWTMLGGAAIIISAGVLIIWRERQLGIERARQRGAGTPGS